MLHFLDPFRDFTLASVALRMLLTVLCGGLIGIERAFKRRSAGFRTHILICLGAAMTTMTSLYLVLVMHYYTDLARLGAQVIAGIGFIGAGTIIVTKRHRVKGLTTAAGLWLTAIIGLCCGAGFYEGAIMATLLDLIAELWFSKLEYRMLADSREITLYVGYQAMQVLFPPNTYETALLATVEDTVDAEGVLLFEESYVAGGGTLGYLVADGERVSAGTAVAEIYSDAAQATLRQQLTQINDQIDLLQRSQNTTSVQLESLRKNRSAALYDLMDSLDAGDYEDTDAEKENYILAQNKLWVITGEVASFSDQITALTQQAATVQSQLGNPSQITAPQTGYFIRSSSSGRLNAGSADILALDAANLKAYVESSPEIALDGCAGKIVSGFTWYYAGVCSAKQAEKLLGRDGKPLTKSVEIRFPGQVETPLKAKVSEVNIDAENDIARFVLSCEIINGDVLRLNCADAQIIVGRNTGLRVPAAAVHYLKEDGSEAEGQGENYIPGVYVKYGNLARFCRIDPVDDAHPQITDGDDLIVLPSGTAGSVSQVRLYDEIIVSGQNLYDGKLL